jgi:hypothetical protein
VSWYRGSTRVEDVAVGWHDLSFLTNNAYGASYDAQKGKERCKNDYVAIYCTRGGKAGRITITRFVITCGSTMTASKEDSGHGSTLLTQNA